MEFVLMEERTNTINKEKRRRNINCY